MKTQIKTPKGYRRLRRLEKIKAGDRWLSISLKWIEFNEHVIGEPLMIDLAIRPLSSGAKRTPKASKSSPKSSPPSPPG